MNMPETIQEELEGEDRSQTTSYRQSMQLKSFRHSGASIPEEED